MSETEIEEAFEAMLRAGREMATAKEKLLQVSTRVADMAWYQSRISLLEQQLKEAGEVLEVLAKRASAFPDATDTEVIAMVTAWFCRRAQSVRERING